MFCRMVILIISLLFSTSWKIGANKWTTKQNFNNFETVKRGMNNSMGHSNELWSLGINNNLPQYSTSLHDNNDNNNHHYDDENVDDNGIIKMNEINAALKDAIDFSKKSTETFIKEGWSLVEDNELFRLYKRRTPGHKMSEYLMIGEVLDVSPRNFLEAQVERVLRQQWDTSMDAMQVLQKNNDNNGDVNGNSNTNQENSGKKEVNGKGSWTSSNRFLYHRSRNTNSNSNSNSNSNNHIEDDSDSLSSGSQFAADIIYYRTKWPWPLKNRDYVLARRCKQIVSASSGLPPALVFVSKSFPGDVQEEAESSSNGSTISSNNKNNNIDLNTLKEKIPSADGAIRVDQYWCHSTFISTQTSKMEEALNAINSNSRSTYHENKNENENTHRHANIYEASSNHKKRHQTRHFRRKHNNQKFRNGERDDEIEVYDNWSPKSPIVALEKVLDEPGTCFVTRFCDECRVPLPQYMIDIIAKHAEKEVRGSIQRLHMAAKDMQ